MTTALVLGDFAVLDVCCSVTLYELVLAEDETDELINIDEITPPITLKLVVVGYAVLLLVAIETTIATEVAMGNDEAVFPAILVEV